MGNRIKIQVYNHKRIQIYNNTIIQIPRKVYSIYNIEQPKEVEHESKGNRVKA